jgi:Ca2+-binding EF-hand superfamily protein
MELMLSQMEELFRLYDSDDDNSLTLNELVVLLQEVGNRITALPAVSMRLPS